MAKSRGMFREKSLERLSSPERLDQLLRIVDPKSWLPLATLAVLVGLVVLWAILGEIPVYVEGKGILANPREVVEFQSPGSGYLAELHVGVDQLVDAGQLLARIDRPDLDKQLDLKRTELAQLRTHLDEGSAGLDGESLTSHLRHSRELAERLRREGREAIEEERELLVAQLQQARDLRATCLAQWEKQKQLHADGIVALGALIEPEEDYMDSQARVTSLETQLRDLLTKELQVQDQYLENRRRNTELRLELQRREQQISEVQREIDRLELVLAEESRIVSERPGRVLEISAAVGQYLNPGDRLGSMAAGEPHSPVQSLAYFTVKDGKRLEEGVKIHVTPDTVERQRYGSIVGTILRVSAMPVTLGEVESMIGNREIAESLVSGGYRMQVLAALNRNESTPSGYDWSSSGGPDQRFSTGTTTTARVAIEQRRPITYLLPGLRSAFGVD